MAPEVSSTNGSTPPGSELTPAMRQHQRFKAQYPDCVLFFRMGDFYEMFYEDAQLAHRVLGVTLTQRTPGVPMAGVPYHAVENYLRRMIQAGYRVAVCEQVQDPREAKGVVERDVTRLVTPGTLTDEALLEDGKENPLAAVMFVGPGPRRNGDEPELLQVTLAWVELSTGRFELATLEQAALADELARLSPRELLFVETANHQPPGRVTAAIAGLSCAPTARPAWQFRQDQAAQTLRQQFGVATLGGFGLNDDDPALGPAAAIIHYLRETQCQKRPEETATDVPTESANLKHIQPPRRFERSAHLVIDQASLRTLEIERTMRAQGTAGSLLGVFGHCQTAMGKRALRQWLCYPLCDLPAITQRQRVVAALVVDGRFLDELSTTLREIQDVERIMARVSMGRALPRDLVGLGNSCGQAQRLAMVLMDRPAVAQQHAKLLPIAQELTQLASTLTTACIPDSPAHLREGGFFRDGFDATLDELRSLQRDSNVWLAGYQKKLIDDSGIASLKVGFNKVFGFYIELTASQKDKAPPEWARKQTLKNAERFITPELKDYETKVLSAEQRAVAREQDLFAQLCSKLQDHLPAMRQLAALTAELDVLACFAQVAQRRRYVQPVMVEEPTLVIRAGRHPVLDEILGDQFVPNDVTLAGKFESTAENASAKPQAAMALITGPNMAGKSTFIRQAALLTLLAHCGSFVPAESATIGLCDRIFTRIGASDELHAGASTFMVEMTETANICHHATARSVVVLDEIGRGTSTLDGLSLAWAIAEHLAQRGCRTLFATHYHEITALGESPGGLPNVTNLHVTVREWGQEIVFLHRVAAGRTDRSYGIHVAKIAGLPGPVVQRALELLGRLSVNHDRRTGRPAIIDNQLPLFAASPTLTNAALAGLDMDQVTPAQALEILHKLVDDVDDSAQMQG